jgi:hypothetical protein
MGEGTSLFRMRVAKPVGSKKAAYAARNENW